MHVGHRPGGRGRTLEAATGDEGRFDRHELGFWAELPGREPETRTVWSVVAKGIAHEVDDMFDRFDAEDLPLYPWVAEQKPSYVRITPEVVTGRRFHVVDSARLEPAGSDRSYHPGEPRLHPD